MGGGRRYFVSQNVNDTVDLREYAQSTYGYKLVETRAAFDQLDADATRYAVITHR